MKRHTPLNRYDVSILFLCVGFALAALGSVGGVGRTRAKDFLCRSHLEQWAAIFESCTQDNDSFFPALEPSDSGRWWIETLWSYHQDAGLFACPAAMEASPDVPATHRAWRVETYTGSYGINGWVGNRKQDVGGHRYAAGSFFWSTPRVWGAARVPVLADMFWVDAWPHPTDLPPATEESLNVPTAGEMELVCVNRHAGSTNVLFADGSVRKVGLKEIWALKWHKTYDTAGPWTVAGGVWPTDWPQWMRKFKEFEPTPEDEDL